MREEVCVSCFIEISWRKMMFIIHKINLFVWIIHHVIIHLKRYMILNFISKTSNSGSCFILSLLFIPSLFPTYILSGAISWHPLSQVLSCHNPVHLPHNWTQCSSDRSREGPKGNSAPVLCFCLYYITFTELDPVQIWPRGFSDISHLANLVIAFL